MSQRRKLAAILSADVVAYSRLMGQDECETINTLQSYRAVIEALVLARHGRVVNAPGDALLAEFPSAVEAVQCATEIQDDIERRNADLQDQKRMRFRIGVNLGDVIEEADGTLYGDGVNVAARLEALAEPAGVCVSGKVFEEVDGRVSITFEFAGEQVVKNIAKPVRVYRVRRGGSGIARRVATMPQRRWKILAAMVIALAGGTAVWWEVSRVPATNKRSELAVPTGLSVAVLPFANMSGDPKQDFFADGITEQIITELARFRDLSVIARNSTFSYKGKAVDVRQVGAELGARYVIEGSVQRGGNSVRVTVQLLDARTGAHLWADSYERDLKRTKVFGIQDDITERVVTAIGDAYGAISRATFEESKGKGTESLDAYECVLRYYAYQRVITPDEHARVRDCLERSMKAAPTYAEAWAALSEIYSQEHSQGFNIRPNALGRALNAAQRAVQLDPASPRAYVVVGNAHFFLHDIDAFARAAKRAIALNPNNVDVLAFYGMLWTYAHIGDPTERARGVEAMKKAIALSPIHPTWYHFPIAWHYYWNEEYETALAETKKIDLQGYWHTHLQLVTIYGAMGRKQDAQASVTRLLELYPEIPRKYREEWRKWNVPEPMIDHAAGDLRRAGLDIPERR